MEHKGEHTLAPENGINDRLLASLPGVRERRRRMTSEYGAVFAFSGRPWASGWCECGGHSRPEGRQARSAEPVLIDTRSQIVEVYEQDLPESQLRAVEKLSTLVH